MPEWLKKLLARRDALRTRAAEINERAVTEEGEVRDLTDEENTEFTEAIDEIERIDERVAAWNAQEARERAEAEHRRELGITDAGDGVQSEPNPVYRQDGTESFFRDLARVGPKRTLRHRLAVGLNHPCHSKPRARRLFGALDKDEFAHTGLAAIFARLGVFGRMIAVVRVLE